MQDWLRLISSSVAFAALLTASALSVQNARAEKIWNWSYSRGNIAASGTFATSETTNAQGFYQIFSITGHRNGELITGLHPTGSAIPGNEPYVLDNLIRIDRQGQLTTHGFGFSTVSGNYANLFFADFLASPSYMEVFITSSNYSSELPVTFSAVPVLEPEIKIEPPVRESGKD
ncbi:hypothetical protein [Nitrosomonas sp. Nm166]|uniref:hypothetical protein n=1 Tax=Nitrosomonas sp. Nm166 TaxID=1881054 RepID=UPI0008EC24DE|nr:hypothetical protein [Nitrosomonas sp. Nm166]SFF22433.1 hypothetical protein SAMN05428977_10754 [Nitrosomonas sp. Nm166]